MARGTFFVLLLLAGGTAALGSTRPEVSARGGAVLPASRAVGIQLDTLLLGGYAAGRFTDAVRQLGEGLDEAEQELVGEHLVRIFGGVLPEGGLGRAGRLRLVYERAVRPDGSTRGIRVLGAEVAVGGRVHTAFYFEEGGRPGYFDAVGRSLDPTGWGRPLGTALVSSPFGNSRMHPILNRVLPHTGVDFAAPAGTAVRAAADGIVVAAAAQGGYGLLIELRHPNGFSTRYAHLSTIAQGVEPGRVVRQGELIGYVGMSGLATGAHLHYEVRRRGQPIDPMRLDLADSPAAELGPGGRWTIERDRVGRLLARTPTVVQARGAVAAGS